MHHRLQELANNEGKGNEKNEISEKGGGTAVDLYVGYRIKCPHEFVFSGSIKERISYNSVDSFTIEGWGPRWQSGKTLASHL